MRSSRYGCSVSQRPHETVDLMQSRHSDWCLDSTLELKVRFIRYGYASRAEDNITDFVLGRALDNARVSVTTHDGSLHSRLGSNKPSPENQAFLLPFFACFAPPWASRPELRAGSLADSMVWRGGSSSTTSLLGGSALPMTSTFLASHFLNSACWRYPSSLNHSANRPSTSLSSHTFPDGAS